MIEKLLSLHNDKYSEGDEEEMTCNFFHYFTKNLFVAFQVIW